MSKVKANLRKCDEKYLQKQLRRSLTSLEKFLDPENEGCGVDPEVRKKAQLYLSTWVAMPLRELFLWAHGEEIEPRYLSDSEGNRRDKKLKELLGLTDREES